MLSHATKYGPINRSATNRAAINEWGANSAAAHQGTHTQMRVQIRTRAVHFPTVTQESDRTYRIELARFPTGAIQPMSRRQ